MNEIFKGMDNAAEQINENFESVETGLVEDVSNLFTPTNQANIHAFRQGKFIYISVSLIPPSGGTVIATTTLDLRTSSALSVHKEGAADNDKPISAVFYTSSGLQIRTSSNFTAGVRLTGVLVIN